MTRSQGQSSELGKKIREFRQRAGLTGQRLAESAQISAGFLSDVERGQAEISVERLQRIAKELDVDVGVLLGESVPAESDGKVVLPGELVDAADELHLSFRDAITIFNAKQSLRARRSPVQDSEWTKDKWIEFYQKMKPYLIE